MSLREITLSVGPNRQGRPYVNASFDLKACKRPALLPSGWAIRPPQSRSRFTSEQRAFLVVLFDWPHGRLNEHQAFAEVQKKFSAADGLYARSLRLS